MGVATVLKIIREVVRIIWVVLQPFHVKIPDEYDLKQIADDFYKFWNFPDYIGSIDGKHVRIHCPAHSGSLFYNYKDDSHTRGNDSVLTSFDKKI